MKIGFIIWSLCKSKGGLERVGVNIANEMKNRGNEIIIYCFAYDGKINKPLYKLDEGIKIEYIESYGDSISNLKIKENIIENNIDVMCGLFSNEMAMIMPKILFNTGIPFIISEHNNPDIIINERWNHYERLGCLTSCDKIHMLVNSFKDSLPKFMHEKTVIIPNPAPKNKFIKKKDNRLMRIGAMGRFNDSHKNFSNLIKAFINISHTFKKWELIIAGDGPDRNKYEELINRNKLSDRVKLIGIIDDVDNFYKSCDIFCIPSRYEGFPMVAIEAQSYGLPLLGIYTCSGVNEIIIHGVNGYLAEDTSVYSIQNWLSLMMQDQKLRFNMTKASFKLNNRYRSKYIYDKWEDLFKELYNKKNKTIIDMYVNDKNEKSLCISILCEIMERQHVFKRQYTLQLNSIKKFKESIINEKDTIEKRIYHDNTYFSFLQRIILLLYSPFVYIFSEQNKYYFDYKFDTKRYFNYTRNKINLFLKKILNMLGPNL